MRDTLCRTSLRVRNSKAQRRWRRSSQKPALKPQQILESSCWERIELSGGVPDKLFLRPATGLLHKRTKSTVRHRDLRVEAAPSSQIRVHAPHQTQALESEIF